MNNLTQASSTVFATLLYKFAINPNVMIAELCISKIDIIECTESGPNSTQGY